MWGRSCLGLQGIGAGLVLLVLTSVGPGRVVAQTTAQPATSYDATIERALSEYDAQNFEEALALFIKAHALSPNARTLRGMAMTEYELRRYVECITHAQQAIDSQQKPLTVWLRAQTQELLRNAQQYVSRVAVQIEPATASASVMVDGVATALAADGSLTLQIGEHFVEVRAAGFESARRKLVLQGGDDQMLSFTLEAVPTAPTAAEPAPPVVAPALAIAPVAAPRDARAAEVPQTRPLAAPQRDDPDSTGSVWTSPWLWTGVGVLGVGIAVVVVAVAASNEPSAARVRDPVTTDNTPPGLVVMALH